MKPKIFIIALTATMLLACTPGPVPIPEEDVIPKQEFDFRLAYMTIVRFQDTGQVTHVPVQHPIKGYNGEGYFEYIYDEGLSLNYKQSDGHSYSLQTDEIDFLQEYTTFTGSTPYIPLARNYYLIDWKWQILCPISAIANHALPYQFVSHLQSHVFWTDVKWSNLTDYTQNWDSTSATQHFAPAEVWRVSYRNCDRFFGEEKNMNNYPFVLYRDGMSAQEAYTYYRYDSSDSNPRLNYITYIAFCDSLQTVYVSRLNDAILSSQLGEICCR